MLQDLLSVIFPAICPGCNKPLLIQEPIICTSCIKRLPVNKTHPNLQQTTLENQGIFYYLNYEKDSLVQNLLHHIKYKNGIDLAVELGKQFGQILNTQINKKENSIIIPIPLYWKKERIRGYNQSKAIAQGLSQSMKIPISENLIKRIKNTSTQTRKSKVERIHNVMDAFKIYDTNLTPNNHLILVDDVLTTGSTMDSCIEALNTSGFFNISIVVLAMVK